MTPIDRPNGALHGRWWRRLLAGCMLAVIGGAAQAADPPVVGKAFTGMIELGSKQISLPAGEWVLAGHGYEMVAGIDDLAYGAVESIVLFRIEHRAVTAFVIAHHNVIPIEDGWGQASECSRSDIPVSLTYDAEEGHTYCGFIAAVDTSRSAASAPSWKQARTFAQEHDLALPTLWRMAGFRLSDRSDVIDVRYHFDAAVGRPGQRRGATLGDTAMADPDPEQSAAATDEAAPSDDSAFGLEPWLNVMHGAIRMGFDNALAGVMPLPMPWGATVPLVSPLVDLRLKQLDSLKTQQLVSAEYYKSERGAIEKAEVKLAPEQMSNEEITALKLLSDQASSAATAMIANFIVLGSINQSLGLLSYQMAVDVFQYTTHEYAWNTYGPSRLREAPNIDFAEAGVIRPTS